MLIISLSIILPNLNKGEQKYYFDDNQITYMEGIEYNDLHALMGNKALKPNVVGIQYTNKSIISKKDGKQIGIYSQILLVPIDFLEITMHVLYKNYVLEELNVNDYLNNDKWQGKKVSYKQKDMGIGFIYNLTLEYNGLQHYFEVKTAREFEIVELLNTLFII